MLTDVLDYAERCQFLETLKNRLEAMLSTQVVAAFSSQSLGKSSLIPIRSHNAPIIPIISIFLGVGAVETTIPKFLYFVLSPYHSYNRDNSTIFDNKFQSLRNIIQNRICNKVENAFINGIYTIFLFCKFLFILLQKKLCV